MANEAKGEGRRPRVPPNGPVHSSSLCSEDARCVVTPTNTTLVDGDWRLFCVFRCFVIGHRRARFIPRAVQCVAELWLRLIYKNRSKTSRQSRVLYIMTLFLFIVFSETSSAATPPPTSHNRRYRRCWRMGVFIERDDPWVR